MHPPHLYQLKHFLILFFPLLLTQIAQVGTPVFASIFSGQYSTIDLAGVAVGSNIWYPIFAGMCGIFFGISPILSQLRGAKKTDQIPPYIQQSFYIILLLTVFIFILGYFFVDSFLGIMRLDPQVHTIAHNYLIAIGCGIFPTFAVATMRYITDAHGMTQVSMAILFVNLILTILLFRLFVFGGFGFAPMGGVGTGIAITTAAWITMFLFMALFQWYEPFKSYHIWKNVPKPDIALIIEQLRIGIPIFIAVFCETSLFSIIGLLMSEFGTLYLAANQAAISYATLVYVFPWSISLAATIVIGYEVGARNGTAARQYAVICQGTAFAIVCVTALVTYLFLQPISAMFTSDIDTLRSISYFLTLAIVFSFCDAGGTPVQGILRGYKDIKVITYVSFVTYWVISIPMGIAIAHLTPLGPYGYWYALIIALGINAVALNTRLWKKTAWMTFIK